MDPFPQSDAIALEKLLKVYEKLLGTMLIIIKNKQIRILNNNNSYSLYVLIQNILYNLKQRFN